MSNTFSSERLTKILLAPHITEKAGLISENRQYAFKVMGCASKPEIKAAVEMLFKVKVDDVRVVGVKPKTKRTGQILGKRKGWKKAYVKLAEGSKIDIVTA
jgi:large subunit ribosomal protein L23